MNLVRSGNVMFHNRIQNKLRLWGTGAKSNADPGLTPKENNTKSRDAAKIKHKATSTNMECLFTIPKNYKNQFKSLAPGYANTITKDS